MIMFTPKNLDKVYIKTYLRIWDTECDRS